MSYINRVSNLDGKNVLAKLEEMEKCMDYLQQQLQDHAGCINEIDFSFPSQKRSQGLLTHMLSIFKFRIVWYARKCRN